jgi:hypothetical protein
VSTFFQTSFCQNTSTRPLWFDCRIKLPFRTFFTTWFPKTLKKPFNLSPRSWNQQKQAAMLLELYLKSLVWFPSNLDLLLVKLIAHLSFIKQGAFQIILFKILYNVQNMYNNWIYNEWRIWGGLTLYFKDGTKCNKCVETQMIEVFPCFSIHIKLQLSPFKE